MDETGVNEVTSEGFEPVDVFQYNPETGVVTQVELIGVDSDPIVQLLVHQAEIDYCVLAIIFLGFLMYLISWGARLWRRS